MSLQGEDVPEQQMKDTVEAIAKGRRVNIDKCCHFGLIPPYPFPLKGSVSRSRLVPSSHC